MSYSLNKVLNKALNISIEKWIKKIRKRKRRKIRNKVMINNSGNRKWLKLRLWEIQQEGIDDK